MILLALNVRASSEAMAERQVEWLLSANPDVLVLSEIRGQGAGCRLFTERLRDASYQTFCRAESGERGVLVATRVDDFQETTFSPFDRTRVSAIVSRSPRGFSLYVGIYVPSRGPRHRRNVLKRAVQDTIQRMLRTIAQRQFTEVIVAGDFNVVEPAHEPRHAVFGSWEYEFYESFGELGFVDAFRAVNHTEHSYSWFGRSGRGYRIDHCFVNRRLLRRLATCEYDQEPRNLGFSDHAALRVVLNDQL